MSPRRRSELIGAVLLTLLVPWLARRMVDRASSRLAVAMAAENPLTLGMGAGYRAVLDAQRDPWGQELVYEWQLGFYSLGPDQHDQQGYGDDVVPTPRERTIGAGLRNGTPIVVAALVALAGWARRARLLRQPRSPQLGVELGRAARLAATPWALVLLGSAVPFLALRAHLGEALARWEERTGSPLPAELSALLTWSALCWCLALGWRLRRPPEGVA